MKHPAVAALDRQLAKKGEPVVFRRTVPNAAQIEIPTRAFVRGYRPEEIVGGITADESLAIISPGAFASLNPLPRKGDALTIGGRYRQALSVGLIRIDQELVRIEMRVSG